MQFNIFLPLVLALSIQAVNAAPAAEADPVPNAEALPLPVPEPLTSRWVADPDVTSGLLRRETGNCKGSSYCGSIDPENCVIAKNKILDTKVYSAGAGHNSGVCHAHCGIFVQGSGCSFNGKGLLDGYNFIRAYGCKQCGNAFEGNGNCRITIDYVTGCPT